MDEGSTVETETRGLLRLGLSVVGLVWYSAIWSIGLIGCRAARKRYRNRPRSPLASASPSSVPGVSILRPLKGLDTNLYENLESSFKQEYPKFELLLSVADEYDQALSVVRELLVKYPGVNARVVIGEEVVGVNPKVNNLIRPYNEAAHDILWILDSNISVAPGTLARAVDILNKPSPTSMSTPRRRIAVVHHVPFAFANQLTLGARIEEAFLNTNHAKMYIAINTLAVDSCVIGKSNLYRRSDLERVDGSLKRKRDVANDGPPGTRGLVVFGRFLAEDNMIAAAMWHELDLRHDLSCDVAKNAVGNMSFFDYVWRRVRWIRVRKHMVLAATLVEPFQECIVLSAIAAASLRYLIGVPPWLFLPVHYTLWIMVDLDVYASLAGYALPPADRWSFIAAWTIRELLALPIWLFAVLGNTVDWRGKKYEVLRHGEVKRAGDHGGSLGRWLGLGRRKSLDHHERIEQA
ncbi:glycosyltransferase family 21 protein [Auriscalpium vulgare]|uniref:Glycosyltransferase family 21 protein n=1 Tax=Auriscalpium vulgare TaxID=40419 RepID=A0ACB8RWD4_9AGAM|nr:glycosyltransferase family 21 protein [Auriscalpium vulgare]